MSNSKSAKHSLLSSIIAVFISAAMLIGTTFAWFTDTASTAVNKIQSGKLDVALEMLEDGEWVSAEGKTLTFKTKDNRLAKDILWEPGCKYELPTLRVVNKGNLALKYKLQVAGIQGSAKLNEAIDWEIQANGTPKENLNGMTDKILQVNADSGNIVISGHMKETAGNDYMNLSIDGIGITVYATQAAVEFDSNGNTYDDGALYGDVVSTQEEFKAAMADGKTIILSKDIALTSELHINKDVTVFGNGHTMFSGAPVRVEAGHSATFKNVVFNAPKNGRNNASNFYAAGLKGAVVFDGCTFSNTEYDSIQIIPESGASITVNGCRFETSNKAQRFIHVEAAFATNADVKITLTNNFFGATDNLKNSMIDLDYINIDGIDFGGNNVYTDKNSDIYVCGPSVARTITKEEAYSKLGALKAADKKEIESINGNMAITAGSSATIKSATTIVAGATISGESKSGSVLNAENAKISSDNVTIKNITINGSGSYETGGTLNINGNNTSLENVNYEGDGNIAIAVSTGKNNTGTVFKKTKITKAFRGIQFWSLSGDSLIDECVLDVAGYTFNIDSAVAGSTLSIRNSTLNGWTSYTSGIKLVSFENCKLGLNAYQYLRPYSETKLTKCDFTSAGYRLNAGGSDAYTITLTDCTKNGVLITADNVKSLLLDTDDWNENATLIVNGKTVTF